MKLAAAPISWGVSEVPEWGIQLGPDRVLDEIRALGLDATEAGPPGFLPADAAAARAVLGRRGLRLIGGFVTAVLHDDGRRRAELASVDRQAAWLGDCGAEVLVLAAATGATGYAAAPRLTDREWRTLFEGIARVEEIAARHSLAVAVHPHFGTMIERRAHIERFLADTQHALCLDTGHIALGGADPLVVGVAAGARVRHVHLKDVDPNVAERVREGAMSYSEGVRQGLYVPLGDGAARIADVLGQLRASHYDGWYVLEQDVMLDRAPEEGPPSWVSRSADYAKRHA